MASERDRSRSKKDTGRSVPSPPEPAVDIEHIQRRRKIREERMARDLLDLLKDPRYKYLAQELLNIKRALEERERVMEAKEKAMTGKVTDLEIEKKTLSQQAAKLAKLKTELEDKISELEKRLAALEDA